MELEPTSQRVNDVKNPRPKKTYVLLVVGCRATQSGFSRDLVGTIYLAVQFRPWIVRFVILVAGEIGELQAWQATKR